MKQMQTEWYENDALRENWLSAENEHLNAILNY